MRDKPGKEDSVCCSFCGHTQDEDTRLVKGQDEGVYICNDCVKLCNGLLTDKEEAEAEAPKAVATKTSISFNHAGAVNTEKTIELAAQRCRELGIKYVVVATSTGETAIKVAEGFKDLDVEIIGVPLHAGLWEKYTAPDPGKMETAREMGVKFLVCTHALMGNVGNAIMEKFGGISLTDLIAHTYYTFSQGTKVAVEIAVMAADAGLISVEEEIISIAGSDTGADTALVIKPAYSTDFFSLKVRELIVKPR